MAVNVFCPECKSSYVVGTKSCKKCGNNLQRNRKYRVFVESNQKRITRVVVTLELARQLELKLKEEVVRREELGIIEAPVIDQVWSQFRSYLATNTKSEDYYEKFWRNHIAPEFAGRRLDTITLTELDNFAAKLRQKTHKLSHNAISKQTKPLALSTIDAILRAIARLYSFATQKGLYLGKDPTKRVSYPQYDNRMTNSLSDDELSGLLRVLREWPNRMAALAFLMCLGTGKRTGEIFGLTWDDVNFETGVTRFRIKSRIKQEYQYLPMNHFCTSALREAKRFRMLGCPLVFHTENGKRIHYEAIWGRIKAKAGLRDCIRAHDLRHTFASRLASSGEVDIFTLQNLLGHKTVAMTNRYAHLLDDALKRGILVADKVLGHCGIGDGN